MSTQLRPLRLSDADVSVHWRNDAVVREAVLGYRLPVSDTTEREWVERTLRDQSKSRIVMAVEDAQDQALIGYIYLDKIDWVSRTAWFGIMIGDKTRQKKGLGQSAAQQMFDYAHGKLGLRKLCVEVAAYNAPSLKFFGSLGFAQEGVLKEQLYLDGAYHDVHLMARFF